MKTHVVNNKLVLIFFSALFLGISQQPFNLGFFSWFALVPFIYVLINLNNYKHVILYSFLWGVLYNLFTVYWLSFNIGTTKLAAAISMILAVFVLSANTIIVSILWFRIKIILKKYSLFIFPFIWVGVEFVRSYGILGFPWISIANSQTNYLYLIQNSEYVSIYGITFWVVLINILIYRILFISHEKKTCLILLIIFIIPWITGKYLFDNLEYEDSDLKISLIQPNINLFNKRDYSKRFENLDSLIAHSKLCINNGSKLIMWPESALPYNNLQNPKTLDYITKQLLVDNDSYLLTGNVIYNKSDHYNSSVLINKDGIKKIYNKRQLVPVAEYVPLSDVFPTLKTLNFGQANFSKGKEDVLFEINNNSFSSLICFESTFPEINRRHVELGADFITYLVNDGWYTTPPQPQQHMRQSIFRAIENRKTVIRCANTGISAVIGPSGKVLDSIELNEKGVITTFIRKVNTPTFYTKYGNVFAKIMLIITMAFFVGTFFKHEKKY